MPVALVVAARDYLRDLRRALNQFEIHLLTAEFERSLSLAAEHQPDIILVASPPIGEAVKACQRLLENPSTTSIPIFLNSLGDNTVHNISSIFLNAPAQATTSGFAYWQSPPGNKGGVTVDDTGNGNGNDKRRQLLSILQMLRNAEIEVSRLNLETSGLLLGATIADISQRLK
ncbi:hypothetical protein [Bradyrhizobium sp. 153]|uniref:hypothetical protein n=1 Tax=Bradyrhizobium sp. 153 TaxID=2782627 RepID=UPI001FF86374|nr:hypothetical protein [Bradyrhizobium sp. 153]MCK1670194.1 hypothetical protein [Bradyrhizobium sp. 153]